MNAGASGVGCCGFVPSIETYTSPFSAIARYRAFPRLSAKIEAQNPGGRLMPALLAHGGELDAVLIPALEAHPARIRKTDIRRSDFIADSPMVQIGPMQAQLAHLFRQKTGNFRCRARYNPLRAGSRGNCLFLSRVRRFVTEVFEVSKIKTAAMLALLLPLAVSYTPSASIPDPVSAISDAVDEASDRITTDLRSGKHLGF